MGNQPELQLTVFHREADDIQRALSGFLSISPAVKQASLHDGDGSVIGEALKDWAVTSPGPDFKRLREGLSPTDEGRFDVSGGDVPARLNVLKTLLFGERGVTVTIPVLSLLNPIASGLNADEFVVALANPAQVRSLHVLGYVNIGISHTLLWVETLPAIALSATLGLLVILGFWLFSRSVTRRVAAPLATLAQQANDFASGKRTETLSVPASGEVGEIATALNGVITGMSDHNRRADTDRKVLSLRVDESSAELSANRQQLSEAQKKASETRSQLQQMVYFDPLTSLPNRRLFLEQLTLLLRLAARNNQILGLVLVDIDNFKRINKSLGATGGDRLLREVAERLTTCVRDSDILHRGKDADAAIMDISRMGGDEFTVVLNQLEDANTAMGIARRLSKEIAKPYVLDDEEVIISSSIGVALAPQHALDMEDLMRASDSAMMEAKKAGRNRIVLFDPSMQGASRERLHLENELRRAIEHEQLILHYQPQVNAMSGEVIGVEALVRWDHPEKGLIPPFRWIPIAEELGLIEQVGAWVLRKACITLMQLREDGLDLPMISVNVSALQLQSAFVELVQTTLKATGLPAESLKLELTEGIMINNHEPTVKLVQQLRDIGVRLSIDDFGTGYSSLSYLTRFPLNELKIDRSFVKGLGKSQDNAVLVRAIIAMAKSLGLDIVVEGVEHVEELMFFRDQNVDIIQGYLFSQPVPEERLRHVLSPEFFSGQLKSYDALPKNSPADTVHETDKPMNKEPRTEEGIREESTIEELQLDGEQIATSDIDQADIDQADIKKLDIDGIRIEEIESEHLGV